LQNLFYDANALIHYIDYSIDFVLRPHYRSVDDALTLGAIAVALFDSRVKILGATGPDSSFLSGFS